MTSRASSAIACAGLALSMTFLAVPDADARCWMQQIGPIKTKVCNNEGVKGPKPPDKIVDVRTRGCVMYQHARFKGWQHNIPENGSYQRFRKPEHNDHVSSVQIVGKCQLVMYQHWDFKGFSQV